MMYQRHISTEYNPEHYSRIPNKADACQSDKSDYDSESVSGIHSYRGTMPNMILNEIPTNNRQPRNTRWEIAIDFQINTESSLANRYCTRYSRMRSVVGRATTFRNRGMTVPESRTPTTNSQHTGSAGMKYHQTH